MMNLTIGALSILFFTVANAAHTPLVTKCSDRYVPETTYEELIKIRAWAVNIAFQSMAKKAGYNFDSEKFIEENPNPNRSAFHFGFSTGRDCYPLDIISSSYAYTKIMNKKYKHNVNEFKRFYIEEANKLGYTKYLQRLNPEAQLELSSF